ncbi:hypothetical protein [Dysgonomonas sp. GY617]|uniref:hypothetical protein n=1 Tax=Dysgonomonas sp. GY617 TaxID=2780420 RepID=UPI001884015B|nr:hypothetical protein [Dysgonomonas sp. GY617]MBF0577727.1 hypothetical protein [Dysgonomonas sp. GY617]
MKASEARKITEQYGVSLTEVLDQIKKQEERGASSVFYDNMNPDTLQRLFELGYRVSKFTDPMGVTMTRVEW